MARKLDVRPAIRTGLDAAGGDKQAQGKIVREGTRLGTEAAAGGLARGAALGDDAVRLSGEVPYNRGPFAARVPGEAGSGLANQIRAQLLKSKASYEKLVAEHRQKLASYRADPFAHDHLGTLAGAPEHLQPKIIEGRIKVLEGQIRKQQGELDKIVRRLDE